MEEDARKYETFATEIFSKCYTDDRIKSFDLLRAQLPKWGDYTCLRMVIKAKNMVLYIFLIKCPRY